MSLERDRQNALLRSMVAVQGQSAHTIMASHANNPNSIVLTYAMSYLRDNRLIIASEGTFTDLLEANNIVHREVRTPSDLGFTTKITMIVFNAGDGRPLAVHRQGVKTVAFDSVTGLVEELDPTITLKPYAYELYASLPVPMRSLTQLLDFSLTSYRSALLVVITGSLVVAIFNLSIPALTSFLVGTVLPLGDLKLIAETSFVVLLIAISTVLSQVFSSLASVQVESLINSRLENALWSHLIRLPLAFFQSLGTSDLVSRVGSISEMRQLISQGLLTSGLGMLFALSSLVLMFTYEPLLASVGAVFSLINVIVMVVLVIQAAEFELPLQESQAKLADMGLQAVIGMPQIRVSGSEPFVFEQWINYVVRLGVLMRRGEFVKNSIQIMSRVLTPLGQFVIIIVVIETLNKTRAAVALGIPPAPGSLGSLNPNDLVGLIVSFQAAFLSFNSQLTLIAVQMATTMSRLFVLWQRSKILIFATPEAGQVGTSTRLNFNGQLQVMGVNVSYPGEQEPVLRDINLTIPQGKFTAITGASGCGKTTLLRCLLRLIDPEVGLIAVDGVDLRELSVRHYRRQLGVVLQNTPLPTGSIYEVVRAGRACSRDEVWEALAQASISNVIESMPMQLNTIITEGSSSISGGQRQRLSLARALIGRPKILLLDEATSALDAPTQLAVTRTLESLPITRIAIAHRLSTIESADQIAVISKGRVSELGTYSELSSRSGGYLNRLDS